MGKFTKKGENSAGFYAFGSNVFFSSDVKFKKMKGREDLSGSGSHRVLKGTGKGSFGGIILKRKGLTFFMVIVTCVIGASHLI